MVVGRLLSYWEGNFSGAKLNFGRVNGAVITIINGWLELFHPYDSGVMGPYLYLLDPGPTGPASVCFQTPDKTCPLPKGGYKIREQQTLTMFEKITIFVNTPYLCFFILKSSKKNKFT